MSRYILECAPGQVPVAHGVPDDVSPVIHVLSLPTAVEGTEFFFALLLPKKGCCANCGEKELSIIPFGEPR